MEKALIPVKDVLDPAKWGWKNIYNGWESLWDTLPAASQTCLEFIYTVNVKKGCITQFKCLRAVCTVLCFCPRESQQFVVY